MREVAIKAFVDDDSEVEFETPKSASKRSASRFKIGHYTVLPWTEVEKAALLEKIVRLWKKTQINQGVGNVVIEGHSELSNLLNLAAETVSPGKSL